MQGLAQEMAQPAMQQAPTQDGMPTVEEIIEALLQGADPEEMIKMGVPPELIMQAIEILEQQMAAQAQPEQGLAAKTVGGM
jgi:phage tail tape-measure protein